MIAVIALTQRGGVLGKRICKKYPEADLYIPMKYNENLPGYRYFSDNLYKLVADVWSQYNYFVFIMATGIVVRTIAPLLKSKLKDPAVVVLDERGKNVISLLSGHFGGANDFTKELAHELQTNAVITTASDIQGIPAFDDIARKNNCVMENVKDLKEIAMAMLEEQTIALYATLPLEIVFPDNVKIVDNIDEICNTSKAIVCITERADISCDSLVRKEIPFVILRPKNIIIGIGCRKGVKKEIILSSIRSVLQENNISEKSVAKLSTIELKKNEPGIIEAAKELNAPLKWHTAEEIKKIESNFSLSEFVNKQVGVGAVCEPAAWLSTKKPLMIAKKRAMSKTTISVVKDIAERMF